MKKEHKTRKLPFRFLGLVLLLSVGLLTVILGKTYSRYVGTWSPGTLAAQAKAFYFTSDLLAEEDPPVYQLADFQAGDKISFELHNYEDTLRVSKTAIDYKVMATGSVGEASGTLAAEKSSVTVELVVPAGSLVNGRATITVTAEAIKPYSKKLSAVFELYEHDEDLSVLVSDSKDSNTLVLTVTTGDKGGSATIAYPEAVLPDSTNGKLTDITSTVCKVVYEAKAQYTIIFFKTDPSQVYSKENFKIS